MLSGVQSVPAGLYCSRIKQCEKVGSLNLLYKIAPRIQHSQITLSRNR